MSAYYRATVGGRIAHDVVLAVAADALWTRDGIDWHVSGDATREGMGSLGMRRAARVSVWDAPGVTGRATRASLDSH